jgi:acetyltransferase-like isoleucine patch superfamily enzyme
MQTGIDPSAKLINRKQIIIGKNVYIGPNTMLHGYYKNNFEIGDNVFISAGCNIYGAGGLIIEDNVGIGPGVIILGSSHKMDGFGPINQQELVYKPIIIREGSDIGAGAIILGGVIGKNTQIGAGAVVLGNIEDNSIAFGVPCKVIRTRS